MPFLSSSSRTSTTLLLLSAVVVAVVAQEGWNDDYKLEFDYDATGDKGPANWDKVISSTSWGEWDVVRDTAGESEDKDEELIDFNNPNQCGREERPSPIEVIPSSACTDTQEMLVRQYNPNQDCEHPFDTTRAGGEDETGPWELTPYSLRYYYPRTDRNCRPPSVQLDGVFADVDRRNVEEHFVLLWLEVHARSEHVIQGRRYDAEIQMVHRSTTRPNELVVVSVLVDVSSTEDNMDVQRYLLDGWQRKHQKEVTDCGGNGRRTLQRDQRHLRGDLRKTPGYAAALQDYVGGGSNSDANNKKMDISQFYDNTEPTATTSNNNRKLEKCTPDAYGNGCEDMGPRRRPFPYNLWPSAWYYSYEGSLTAPPCAGQVHWRIMDTPLAISRRQYKQLTYLLTQSRDERCRLDTAASSRGENFRPLQNATLSSNQMQERQQAGSGPQVVSHCTKEDFFVAVYDEAEQ